MRPTDAEILRALREAANTYASLVGAAGLPVALTRRVISGRMLRANAIANAIESALAFADTAAAASEIR